MKDVAVGTCPPQHGADTCPRCFFFWGGGDLSTLILILKGSAGYVHLFVYIHLFICKTIALPFASDSSGNAELRPILSKERVTTPKFKKKSIYILRQSDSDPQTMQGIDATQRLLRLLALSGDRCP